MIMWNNYHSLTIRHIIQRPAWFLYLFIHFLGSSKFLVSDKKILIHFPIVSYIKHCPIHTKNLNSVWGHPMTAPVNLGFNHVSSFQRETISHRIRLQKFVLQWQPSWIFNLHIHKKKCFPKIIPAKFQPHWQLNGSKISDKNDFLTGIKVIILDGGNLGFFIHIKNEDFVRDHLVINHVQLGCTVSNF